MARKKRAPDETMSFDAIESLQRQIDALTSRHAPSLQKYYNEKKGGFWRKFKENDPAKISKASTSTCLASLVAVGQWTPKEFPWHGVSQQLFDELVAEVFKPSANSGLKDRNPFTVAFQLEAALILRRAAALVPKDDQKLKVKEAVAELIKALDEGRGSVQIKPYPSTTYLTQLVIRTLKLGSPDDLPDGTPKAGLVGALPETARGSVRTWTWQQLLYELALFSSASKSVDPFALAYAVTIYASVTDLAELPPQQKQILRTAIDSVFECQLPDGSWPRSRPLFHYADLGNAYCFEYEMLTQFLSNEVLLEYFLRHLGALKRAVVYLQDSAFNLGDGRFGWASGHHPQLEGPESWSTASAYHFLHQLGRVLAEALRRDVFQFAQVPYVPLRPPKENPADFAPSPRFLDAHLYIKEGDEDKEKSLRDEILSQFVLPLSKAAKKVKRGLPISRDVPMSLLMFGPPGTSKTSLAELIADYLGWAFLPIDPSHVVAGGWDRIHATATALFKRLASLEQTVIFLDEFDEMVRERQEKQSQPVSRFFTTAMLPQLAAINKKRRSALIVATNHVEAFDAAILRRGRFDLVVQVMPPHTQAKLQKWNDLDAHLKKMNFNIDLERSKIDAFTYAEFSELVGPLMKCTKSQEVIHELDNAYARSTLKQQVSHEPPSNDEITWGEASVAQRSFIRLTK